MPQNETEWLLMMHRPPFSKEHAAAPLSDDELVASLDQPGNDETN